MKFGLRGVIEVNFGLREVTEMMKIENYSEYVWKIMHPHSHGRDGFQPVRSRAECCSRSHHHAMRARGPRTQERKVPGSQFLILSS